MFEISLTATPDTADKVLEEFRRSVPQFTVTEHRKRGGNDRNCYIYLKLEENGKQFGLLRGGRPKKLTDKQVEAIKQRLQSNPECNRTRLAQEFGVSYSMILRIAKEI